MVRICVMRIIILCLKKHKRLLYFKKMGTNLFFFFNESVTLRVKLHCAPYCSGGFIVGQKLAIFILIYCGAFIEV